MAFRSKYTYKPLKQQNDIRLLNVRPGNNDDLIDCEIKSYTIREKARPLSPSYTAISYVWGSKARDRRIRLHGRELCVTTSAYNVLKQVRLRNTSRLVWIDSICINQDDDAEKGYQVQLMGHIFSQAAETFAWLGEKDGSTDLAIDFVIYIAQRYGNHYPDESFWNVSNRHIDERFESAIPDPSAPPSVALCDLLSRPWWRRIWILQEFVLSRHLRIFCGQRELYFSYLSTFFGIIPSDWFHRKRSKLMALAAEKYNGCFYMVMERRLYHPAIQGNRRLRYISDLEDFKAMKVALARMKMTIPRWVSNKKTNPDTISELLKRCHNFGATDPRDYVYGLLGIAASSGISPDYRKSTEEVYTETTAHLIKTTNSPELLHMAGYHSNSSKLNLPSWVPDFSQLSSFVPYYDKGYSAGGNTFPIPSFANGSITLKGRIVDSVDCIALEAEDCDVEEWPWYRYFTRALEMTKSACRTQEDLWRTLVVNNGFCLGDSRIDGRYPAPPQVGHYFQQFCSRYLQPEYQNQSFKDLTRMFEDDASLPEKQHEQGLGWIYNFEGQHNLFATTPRDDLALVPFCAQRGDLICIIEGCNIPILIRENGSQLGDSMVYELLKSCYVHGLMEGQGRMMGSLQDITLA